VEIETARLILRPPRLADVPALFAFLGDRRHAARLPAPDRRP
jgi:RimJ/RimL family protein N-acetyltransferase